MREVPIRSQVAAALALVVLVLAAPPAARADGDPASDVLTEQPVFYGSALDLRSRPAAQLDALVREANRRGYAINVVVISRLDDMGSVTDLYDDPDRYGDFLAGEIGCCVKGRLLIVMPSALGVTYIGHSSRADRRIVDALPAPGTVPRLLPAAIDAVIRLAAAAHVQLAVPDVTPAPQGVSQPVTHASAPRVGGRRRAASGGSNAALFLVPAAVLVLAAIVGLGRRRLAGARAAHGDSTGGNANDRWGAT